MEAAGREVRLWLVPASGPAGSNMPETSTCLQVCVLESRRADRQEDTYNKIRRLRFPWWCRSSSSGAAATEQAAAEPAGGGGSSSSGDPSSSGSSSGANKRLSNSSCFTLSCCPHRLPCPPLSGPPAAPLPPPGPGVHGNVVATLRARGLIQDVSSPDLERAALRAPLAVYCGFDPTAESLHLGNLLGIIVLRWFQAAGHTPVALLGGATGRVGDPSGEWATPRVSE